MNNIEHKKVFIKQIDFGDRSYIFTYESPISQLINSIKEIGIIHLPILEQKSKDLFRIVSGLKRILALRHLKIDQFDALVYDSQGSKPDLSVFLLNLYQNIGTRTLNTIEKATALHKLIHFFHLTEDDVMAVYFPLLDLGTSKLVLERYLKLVQLEDNIKIAVAEEFISIETAIALLEKSPIERQVIFNLFQQLKLGKNRQKEFLGLLTEISAIDNRPIDLVLLCKKIQDVLLNTKITPPRKTEYIKEILKKMRYPLLASTEENFQQIKKDLKLPPNIILRPPPFFEGEKYTVEFSFKNQTEFKKLTEILKSIADQNKMVKLESLV